jgi:UDP-N-acetylglucosamine diphosphorylase/glucosamine-1-phosphate N-acetyltransferase
MQSQGVKMAKKLFVFEDDRFEDFYPLTHNRPVYQLLFGIRLIREKISSFYPGAELILLCRDHLKEILKLKSNLRVNDLETKDDDELLFINGRVIPPEDLSSILTFSTERGSHTYKNDLIAFTLKGSDLREFENEVNSLYHKDSLESIKSKIKCSETESQVADYLWNLIDLNRKEIESDFKRLSPSLDFKNMFKGCEVDTTAIICNPENVFIGKSSKVGAYVVLDASEGPIYVGEDVLIKSHTRVEGPAYIGKGTHLVGGKIGPGCSLGPVCRVGGEVENSTFLGFSNKYHEGFLGHSYVGEWINLGALTTNSDLKNNYSPVKVQLKDSQIDTGLTKAGAFLGDHVKTGIGTLLNTGINVGFGANLFGGGMVKEKFIPSFAWYDGKEPKEYRLDDFVLTASEVMKRRGEELRDEEKDFFKKLFNLTKKEREKIASRYNCG